jgi:YbbR domain-containing protein
MMNFFRRYVLNNLGLKVISLVVAVLLWLAVSRSPMSEIAITVPIQFYHVPDNLEISSEHIPQAQIRIRGPERAVRNLDQEQVHAAIDLTGAKPGERTYNLAGKHIHVPHGLEIVQVVPSQFRINFDTRATKEIEVRPRVIGTFASGYRIASVTADPAKVQIVGPERRVDAIDSAVTDPVDASGVVGQATFTTNVFVPDPMVQLARPGPIHVTVTTEKSNR